MKILTSVVALVATGVLFTQGHYAYGVLGLVVGGVVLAVLGAHDK